MPWGGVFCRVGWGVFGEDIEPGIEPVVGKEWGDPCRVGDVVVMGKLGEWEEVGPVILLVTDVGPEVLFHDCVNAVSLSVGFGVKHGGQVWGDL